MKSNRWIELSQRFYRRLLHLYPQAYRTIYEDEMARFFTSECREAYQQRGRLGILLLWLRTFVDVGKTVLIEHLSDPNARVGILEAMPNAPLPWKGVFLVLIPGLVFFISQIMQLVSDKDWFFIAYNRAAFFLIVPVLLVWLLTRRFPVWGLIPLGLLYGTLAGYNPTYLISKLGLYTPPASPLLYPVPISPGYLIAVFVCAISLCGLIGYYSRRKQISRSTWRWLGIYGFLIVLKIVGEFYSFRLWQSSYDQNWTQVDVMNFSLQMPVWYLYDALPFLLLIFIGKVFTRPQSGLSFLLLLGYMLPIIVFGRYGEWTNIIPFSMVVSAVLIYRFVVALLAPVWLARASSMSRQQHAVVIPVSVALLCHIALRVINELALINQYGYQVDWVSLLLLHWNQLLIAVGLALAVTLYFPKQQDNIPIAPPFVALPE